MAAALRALLREILWREQLAGVLLRGADIDDLRAVSRDDFLEHVIAKRPDRGVRTARAVLALRIARGVVRQRTFFRDPFGATAVHELHVLVAVVLEKPEEPGRKPVVVIAVRDDRRARRDALLRQKPLQLLLIEQIADRVLLKVGLPVQTDRPGNVALLVRARVDVDLEHPDVLVLRVLCQPIGLDEHVVCVIRHVIPLSISRVSEWTRARAARLHCSVRDMTGPFLSDLRVVKGDGRTDQPPSRAAYVTGLETDAGQPG